MVIDIEQHLRDKARDKINNNVLSGYNELINNTIYRAVERSVNDGNVKAIKEAIGKWVNFAYTKDNLTAPFSKPYQWLLKKSGKRSTINSSSGIQTILTDKNIIKQINQALGGGK